jgi:murein DD-endopeptidase MepM/ murein hydrolase activator NlpD
VDPEEVPVDQVDALAALIAPQVSRVAPEQVRAAPEQEPAASAIVAAPPTIQPAKPAPAAQGAGTPVGRGEGECFQPVPGGQLVDGWRRNAAGERRGGIDVVAPEGTPVHAVAGGTVVSAERSGRAVRVKGDDGRGYSYMRMRDGSVTVAAGQRVEAGRIVGAVGGTAALSHLHLEISEPDGSPVNPYDLLLGLPDPNELGYGAVGLGVDIDPDPTDREAARPGQEPQR